MTGIRRMRPKALLFDLDNTLYEYEPANTAAKSAVVAYISTQFNRPVHDVETAFTEGRKHTHQLLHGTASSHNRLLYLQHACETLQLGGYDRLTEMHQIFWKTYFDNMKPRLGVREFLSQNKHPLCIVTDFAAEKQFEKLSKLGLLTHFQLLVSSEEVGCEKPESKIFREALRKLRLSSSEVCMIGDDFRKDVEGANACGIFAYWFNETPPIKKAKGDYQVFSCFNELQGLIDG